MIKFKSFYIFFIVISCISSVFANAILTSSNTFNSVKFLIQNEKHPHHTILVLDDDDTLTMMPCPSASRCQYLGSPEWFDWQMSLPVNSSYRVAKTISGILDVNTLIMRSSKMPLVESIIPEILKLAKKRGIRVIVATARGLDMISVTEHQLNDDHILQLIESNTVLTPLRQTSFAGYYLPEKGKRPIAYHNGILYLSGQNKGVMLKDFLKRTNLDHQSLHIIFVDDTLKNDQQVTETFAHHSKITATSIHYTYLKKYKENFFSGKQAAHLQKTADQKWKNIFHSLKQNLVELSLSS